MAKKIKVTQKKSSAKKNQTGVATSNDGPVASLDKVAPAGMEKGLEDQAAKEIKPVVVEKDKPVEIADLERQMDELRDTIKGLIGKMKSLYERNHMQYDA